ncbi:MAG: SUMF1/EgtB/PvdO family nonheme iron enzyme [Planctomycetia bacterium]|nr:SUMF1/EgtB/PvdO family nonheme iron enzyme [Planctomycetia bacterium]
MKKLWILSFFALLPSLLFADEAVRTWKSKTGKNLVEAELIEVIHDGETLRLRKSDGKVVRLGAERISEADREYLEAWLAKNRSVGEGVGAKGMQVVESSRRFALLVGVNSYSDKLLPRLPSCGKDVVDIAHALEKYAGFERKNIIILTDEPDESGLVDEERVPTGARIRAEIEKLGELPKDSLLIVAFSGHGVMIDMQDGTKAQSWLCPTDAKLPDTKTLVNRSWVFEQIDKCPAERKIFFSDACRNEFSLAKLGELASRSGGPVLRAVEEPSETWGYRYVLISSCSPRQVSIDTGSNGLFFKYILEGLANGGAATRDGDLTPFSWFDYAAKRTETESEELIRWNPRLVMNAPGQTKQIPRIECRGEMSRMVIAKLETTSLPPVLPPTPTLPGNQTWETFSQAIRPTLDLLVADLTEHAKILEDFLPTSQRALLVEERIRRHASTLRNFCSIFHKQRLADLERLQTEGYRSTAEPVQLAQSEVTRLAEFLTLLSPESSLDDIRRVVDFIIPRTPGDRMVKTIKGVEYAFRWCPAGSFMMGGDGYTQHRVTLTQGFWMLETEVTQAMWESVMGSNPSYYKGSKRPVECVSWHDCVEFCEKLSQESGLKITLPTEAQWEYACRAGTTTAYSFGDSKDELYRYGNYCDKSCTGDFSWKDTSHTDGHDKTAPVGSFKPNPWGLYDMHGNVWEWCQDWYDEDYYAESPTSDPKGPDSGSSRVDRGGSWYYFAGGCRSAYRYYNVHANWYDVGFRLLFVP